MVLVSIGKVFMDDRKVSDDELDTHTCLLHLFSFGWPPFCPYAVAGMPDSMTFIPATMVACGR